jgi:soluble lytic murein transglycosylase-like protein
LQVFGRIIMAGLTAGLLSGCAGTVSPQLSSILPRHETPQAVALAEIRPSQGSPRAMDGLIAKYSAQYQVPESLIRRIIVRESGYNAKARNGPYYGLMQIRYDTAQSMGYRGPASGLLDAETNLQFGVKYLSGAYKVGGGNPDRAVSNYASGYYYAAKAKGLLEEVGLR